METRVDNLRKWGIQYSPVSVWRPAAYVDEFLTKFEKFDLARS